MNKLFKNSIVVGVIALQLIVPMMALGIEDPIIDTSDPNTPIDDICGIVETIKTITNWLLVFLVILAVIFVIMAAFKYLGAGGDSEKVGAANKQIIYAAVAVAVGLLAKAVPYIVKSLVGGEIYGC